MIASVFMLASNTSVLVVKSKYAQEVFFSSAPDDEDDAVRHRLRGNSQIAPFAVIVSSSSKLTVLILRILSTRLKYITV